MERDNTIDILKGIGILLVVIGHSGCPQLLSDIIYSFHMPLFFIASGWFFSDKCLSNKKLFFEKKVRNLYLPFVKWSVIFLLLHNVLFYLGVINSEYGTITGETNELLSIKDIILHLFGITLQMRGYDGLLGAYWFIRALFVGLLVLCYCSWLVNKLVHNTKVSIAFLGIVSAGLGGSILLFETPIPFWPQGGYREMMAIAFICVGFFLRRVEINSSIFVASLLLFGTVVWIHPTSMNQSVTYHEWYTIIVSGTCGYIVTYRLSKFINLHLNLLDIVFSRLGRESFYILTFHFLLFKPFSLCIALLNGLDWKMVGSYPIVWQINSPWYWIAYSISSVGLIILLLTVVRFSSFSLRKFF